MRCGGGERLWSFAVGAAVALILLDVAGFAQAKVKEEKMHNNTVIYKLVDGNDVLFRLRGSRERVNVTVFEQDYKLYQKANYLSNKWQK